MAEELSAEKALQEGKLTEMIAGFNRDQLEAVNAVHAVGGLTATAYAVVQVLLVKKKGRKTRKKKAAAE